MRLFISIQFDEETIQNILAVQQRLQKQVQGSFSRAENFHLTLVFLGEIRAEQVPAVCNAINLTAVSPILLSFNRVGCFHREDGDIWWIGLKPNSGLCSLQAELIRQLASSGIQLPHRHFSPHVTFARKVKASYPPTQNKLLEQPFTMHADAISLMCSERIEGILRYTELHRTGEDNPVNGKL